MEPTGCSGLNRTVVIFNPILNFDTKLFVEPLLLKASKSEILRNSMQSYEKFFSNILKLLRASKEEGDKMWRAAKELVYFPEYKATCIGYGSESIHGSGAGRELSDQILRGAKDIIDAAKGDPDIFLLAPLLEKGIGPDLISDMTQRIVDEEICQFTLDVMEKFGIKGTFDYKTKSGNHYLLSYNSFSKCPIKLLPRDILSELPLAESFDTWLVEIAEHNSDLRENVNLLIGNAWIEATKAHKKESLLNELKTNKAFFLEILKVLREYSFEHYDLEKDYQGLHRWLENSEQFLKLDSVKLKNLPEESQESLLLVVEEIVRNFQNLIEKNELWRMFWTTHKDKSRHVRELLHQNADGDFKNTVMTAFGLANKASELFESSKTSEKRELIAFVFSNLKLRGAKLEFELKKPFDMMVNLSTRSEWLPLKTSNC